MGETFELKNPESGGDSNTSGTPDYALIPDGTVLRATVVKIETVEKPFKDKITDENVKKVQFRFRVTEQGEFFGKNVWGETSTAFVEHENCRLRSWIGEILGVADLPNGFTFNTDDLVDCECRIAVEVHSYKDRDQVTQRRNRVTDVLRSNAVAGVM